MKSVIFPFLENKKDYQNGSSIIKENQCSIEYHTEHILKVINNEDPTQDFSDFTKISKAQLNQILKVVTKNIVEINL